MSLREPQTVLWRSLSPSVHCGRTRRRRTVLSQCAPAPPGTKGGDAASKQDLQLGNKCVSAKLWMGCHIYLLSIFNGKLKKQISVTAKQASQA